MASHSFRKFFESTDIFGFAKKDIPNDDFDHFLAQPIKRFDLEFMMEILAKKKVGTLEGVSHFMNEVQWGHQPGAVKAVVDTGYTFYIKRLVPDREGEPRWITKRMYQLNRNGYGGYEESVAQEIFEEIEKVSKRGLDSPKQDFDALEDLVLHVYNRMKIACADVFLPEGIKKVNENAYLICFGVRGQGVEAPGWQRVEQNQTMVSYDPKKGTIRIFNYNVESPTGKAHSWSLRESDLDVYFMPTQPREEIASCLEVHMKYY